MRNSFFARRHFLIWISRRRTSIIVAYGSLKTSSKFRWAFVKEAPCLALCVRRRFSDSIEIPTYNLPSVFLIMYTKYMTIVVVPRLRSGHSTHRLFKSTYPLGWFTTSEPLAEARGESSGDYRDVWKTLVEKIFLVLHSSEICFPTELGTAGEVS